MTEFSVVFVNSPPPVMADEDVPALNTSSVELFLTVVLIEFVLPSEY